MSHWSYRSFGLALFVVLLAFPATLYAQPSVMTNSEVVKLVKGGVPTGIIKISIEKARERKFDTSADALVELKKSGVPDEVIALILTSGATSDPAPMPRVTDSTDPAQLREEGIYLESRSDGTRNLIKLTPGKITGTRSSGGFMAAISGGISKSKSRYRVRDKEAEHRSSDAQPVFYVSGMDPRDLVLLKLEKKGDEREFTAGEIRSISGSLSGPKGDFEFTTEKVALGVYKILITNPLPAGEYGFGISSTSAGMVLNVFGFGIDKP